jgi:hypothetical protein
MIGAMRAIKTFITAATIISWLVLPAYPQAFGKKGGYAGPPVDKPAPVDEKAYKAALDRIPAPDRPYDPWGIARAPERVKTTKKSNQ